MGRPFTMFPKGARKHLEAMASHGLLSETRAADSLGMPLEQFQEVIKEHKDSRLIWEAALAIERDLLVEVLYEKATKEGDIKAAQHLLATRHGISEKQPLGGNNGVQITFQLPSAMDAGSYLNAIQPQIEASKPEALGNDNQA